jgi:hypothetical protein
VNKIVCSPLSMPFTGNVDLQFVLFGRPSLASLGAAGPTLFDDVEQFGIAPPVRAWDLLSLALGIGAADEGCVRKGSSDGWTREIHLNVAVQDATFWSSQRNCIEKMLHFLTGDIWRVDFGKGGTMPPKPTRMRASEEDCVCLLSGGADSLTGAIDLVAKGKTPLLVSQVSKGDKDVQRYFANTIAGANHHLQLNHNISLPNVSERSQRARSVLFIAYGVLAATSLEFYKSKGNTSLFIPENGYISLNVPLTPLRMGSLSTRTTHPYYMGMFQRLLDAANLRVKLENPYQFQTKGELFKQCKNQKLLKKLACQSTSCGRYARMGFQHCGRCVPCIIRRAALYAYGITDTTKYRYGDLSINNGKHRHFDDVRSASFAVHQVKSFGLESWIGGALSTTQLGDTTSYRALISRGIDELSVFLDDVGAL